MRDDHVFASGMKKEADFETKQKLMHHSWRLQSIYEAGLVPDVARYRDVEVVFGPMHIYALYGTRAERFSYRFLSPRVFEVNINNIPFRCRISRLTDTELRFHADAPEHHFIVEMRR